MKISTAFILRTIADEHLLIPTGSAAAHVQGLISLNETGALLYQKLSAGASRAELVDALTAEYDVSPAVAMNDVDDFLEQMQELGILLED